MARRSGVPLSRISRRVAERDDYLGLKLFERTTRRVRLTEECRRLLYCCQDPVEALQNVSGFADGTRRSAVRITAPPLAVCTTIGGRLLDYAAENPKPRTPNPDVSIDLTVTNARLDLYRDNVDLAFRLGPMDDSSLAARGLWSVPYRFRAGSGFVSAYGIGDLIAVDRLRFRQSCPGNPDSRTAEDGFDSTTSRMNA